MEERVEGRSVDCGKMSEGIKQRTGASKRTSADHPNELKESRDRSKSKQQKRSFLSSLLLGIFSFIWLLVKVVFTAISMLYLVCVILMYSSPALREHIIYLNSLRNPFEKLSDPVSFGLPVNTVNFYITGSAGRLGAWDIPAEPVSKIQDSQPEMHSHLKDGKTIILYLHGNAYTRATGHRIGIYKRLIALGYHVITIDYRGFGDSQGKPSENGLIQDGISAMMWIRSQSPDASLYIWGHSLGSGVAGGVAKILCDKGAPPSGIILEAPFNNVWEGAVKHPITIPFRFLPYFNETVLDEVKEVFRTDKRLADVYCPILILHDREDEIISFELGKKLYESAKKTRPADAGPIKFIEFNENLGHKWIYLSERLPEILRDFIKSK